MWPTRRARKARGTLCTPRGLGLIALVMCVMASPGAAPALGATGDSQVTALQSGPAPAQGAPEWQTLSFQPGPVPPGLASSPLIGVDDTRVFQPVWGVGAALTNSSSYLIQQGLPASARSKLIANLFSPAHAHLSFVRISIGGSDFNVGGERYSEDDVPPGQRDPSLRHFSLRRDRDTIAVLRQALRFNRHLRILASPWSSPAWMKTNDSLENVSFKGRFEPRYYASYARYFVKFIQGYQRAGVPIWGVTVENEPFGVPATYEGMSFPAPQEAHFVRSYLRPALKRARLHPYIYALDASWDGASYARTQERLAGGLDGVAWHCYVGNPDQVMPTFRSQPQVLSECAANLSGVPVSALLSDVLGDGARAAALWNIAEDPSGGPVVPPNQNCKGCQGLVTIDPGTRRLTYNQDFFSLRQFGRFLLPGAVRTFATRLGYVGELPNDPRSSGLDDVAFRNRDGSDVLVVFNRDTHPQAFVVSWRGMTLARSVPPRWTVTLRWMAR